MEELNEALLSAWIRLSASVINSRVVEELSYSESQVCHALYRSYQKDPDHCMTATSLCAETKMLKSQMNRTLNLLESKGIITRQRSEQDKRHVYVRVNWEGAGVYRAQHDRILKLVDGIIGRMGISRARDAVDLLNQIANIADDCLSGK